MRIGTVLLILIFLGGCGGNQHSEKPDSGISCSKDSLSLFQGERTDLHITVRNRSSEAIAAENSFFLSYHLYDSKKKLLSFDNRRFSLPRTIAPQESRSLTVPFFFNHTPGKYWVELDIVKEGAYWGGQSGWKTSWIALDLHPLVGEPFKKNYLPTWYSVGDELIDAEQYLLRLTLKNCEQTGGNDFFAFSAGSTYPQSWIRDTATLMFLARYYYPLPLLKGVIERFFFHQSEDGSIVDWIDNRGRTDKNTVETDQESSLVIAARWLAMEDPIWLNQSINGKSILDRLEWALDWVWKNKRDSGSGLIISGFTADWGDVENTYPDQRAVKWSTRSQPVIGIYTQSKYIQAVDAFLEMAQFFKREEYAEKWRERSELLRRNTRKLLFNNNLGIYWIHKQAGKLEILEVERDMLALGGNAEAMLAGGLMSREEIGRFLELLEDRRKQFGLNTVFFTLIPPYPHGFFLHPLMKEPWSYQNGGAWDWIGGRYIQALFRNGYRKEAVEYLRQMLAKHQQAGVIFEWEDQQGNGQGAAFYAGAAGVVGEAVFHDYLGISEDFHSIHLNPNLYIEFSVKINITSTVFFARIGKSSRVQVASSEKKIFIDDSI